MASQIQITGNGSYNLGAGEYKIVSLVGSSGETVDIISPVAGTIYTFSGNGSREIFLSRDPVTHAVTQAVVSGFVSPFTITLERVFPTCS